MKSMSLVFLILTLTVLTSYAQNKTLAVGTSTPNSNAALHVESPTTNQGILIPRLNTLQRTGLGSTLTSTDVGLILFDTDLKALAIWNGTGWDIGSKVGTPISIDNSALTGSTASLTNSNVSNTSPALTVNTSGTGNAIETTGKIQGGQFIGDGSLLTNVTGALTLPFSGSTAVSAHSLRIQNNATTGAAGLFVSGSATNSNPALIGSTSSAGSAGQFNVNGTTNTAPALDIVSQGIGNGLKFTLVNASNSAAAIDINHAGTGNAITANRPIQATQFIGSGAGLTGLSGGLSNDNTPFGAVALFNLSSGIQNTAIGAGTLFYNTIGMDNTALGRATLFANVDGSGNTGIGSSSLMANTSGASNTGVGFGAMSTNTTGNDNVAVGRQALNSNLAGSSNTAIGYQALHDNASGNGNTAIGYNANVSLSNFTNATAIGNGAIVNASNKVRIGDASVSVIEGQVAFTAASDKRLKTNVQDLSEGLDFVMKLKPVSYYMKNQQNPKLNWGFIAQDIEALVGTENSILTIGGDKERTLGLRYTDFVAPLVNAVQEQQVIIDKLAVMVQSQAQEIEILKMAVKR